MRLGINVFCCFSVHVLIVDGLVDCHVDVSVILKMPFTLTKTNYKTSSTLRLAFPFKGNFFFFFC